MCGEETWGCGYSEPFFIFMPSHHKMFTDGLEVALAENVEWYLPELWSLLQTVPPGVSVFVGASVYRFVDSHTSKAPSGRVERMPRTIGEMWKLSGGDYFKEPPHYREQRASDKKSMKSHLSSRRALTA